MVVPVMSLCLLYLLFFRRWCWCFPSSFSPLPFCISRQLPQSSAISATSVLSYLSPQPSAISALSPQLSQPSALSYLSPQLPQPSAVLAPALPASSHISSPSSHISFPSSYISPPSSHISSPSSHISPPSYLLSSPSYLLPSNHEAMARLQTCQGTLGEVAPTISAT
ncbi:hypothetical protein Vafri_13353, partial [Volvox africanus]